MAKKSESKKPPPPPAAAADKPAMPDQRRIWRDLGTRLGLPIIAAWLIAAFFNHWVGYAIAGALTLAAGGLAAWALRRLEKTKAVASILGAAKLDDKEGRKAALEKLEGFKKDDLAASLARAQLLMQDDPDGALAVLEGIDVGKALPAEGDQVRFQRALIHLSKGEVDKARALVDHIDLSRQEDAKARAVMAAVVAEAWGRTGQAKKAKETLDLYDANDPSLGEMALQLWRARAFVSAAQNDMKTARHALRKLSEQNPQFLGIFVQKRVHPLLAKEATDMLKRSGVIPQQRPQFRTR
ncbi:MAG: tetratricopeptide repeat protein [Polyangiaceae bacterium]|nr:tetratricopeptide repeat protein [Polyangiaceae bacterium]